MFYFRLEVRNKAPIVLCELLFNDKMFKEKQIEKYSNLMLRFTHENQKAQKYLLGGIEKTVEVHAAVLMPRVPHILKALYEEDILEEEVLFEWAKKVSKKNVSKETSAKIHEKAQPFIKWLKEAEEESESDDDEIEVDFDDRAKISKYVYITQIHMSLKLFLRFSSSKDNQELHLKKLNC